MRRWIGTVDGDSEEIPALVTVAPDESARAQLKHEVAALRWASAASVPVPRLLATADSWCITEYLQVLPSAGSDYVEGSLAAARRIREAGGHPPVGVSNWRGSKWNLPVRILRAVQARLPMVEFRTVRAEAAELPADVWVHGDFHLSNVLHSRSGVAVVDWEYAGKAPLGTDELRMWSVLHDRRDRDHLMEQFLPTIDERRYPQIGLLMHWLALRLFAENATGAARYRDRTNLAVAREVLPEARQWRRSLDPGWK